MAQSNTQLLYARNYAAQIYNLQNTDRATAGELVWLATIQCAQTLAHRYDEANHPQTRNAIRDDIGRLNLPRDEQRKLRDILDLIISVLHGGAYRPDTIQAHHQQDITQGCRLLTALDAHCQRNP